MSSLERFRDKLDADETARKLNELPKITIDEYSRRNAEDGYGIITGKAKGIRVGPKL